MDYISIFHAIPWPEVGISVLQTLTLYWLLLLGIKTVGRRVFGSMGPQDMVVLFLVAEACDMGLSHEKAGYWGAVFSVLTILVTGGLVERSKTLRKLIEEQPIPLYKDGQLQHQALKRNMVDEEELEQVAREYGIRSYQDFECMMLEEDGSITGVLRSEARGGPIKSKEGNSIVSS